MDDFELEVRGPTSMSASLLVSLFEDPTADMVDFRRLRASTGDVWRSRLRLMLAFKGCSRKSFAVSTVMRGMSTCNLVPGLDYPN
jgi:hypothetical protein